MSRGSASARCLSSHAKLMDNFLSQMGHRVSPERQHALRGQAYLKWAPSLQFGGGSSIRVDARTFSTLYDYDPASELECDDFPEFNGISRWGGLSRSGQSCRRRSTGADGILCKPPGILKHHHPYTNTSKYSLFGTNAKSSILVAFTS